MDSDGSTTRQEQVPPADLASIFRALDSIPVGAYTCDVDGLITYFNQAAVRIWGRAPVLGSPVDRWCGSFRLWDARTHELIPHDRCWMALAIREGQPYLGREIEIERPDGTRRMALAHANPIRDEQGRVTGCINLISDITEPKRASDAQARLAALVESSSDAIYSKSLDGTIHSWNQEAVRLFGFTAQEAIGAPITLIVPPEEREAEEGILARVRKGERVGNYETVRVAKDGRRLDVSLTISPIVAADGRMLGASSIARDITERKRQHQGLRQILEMSGRLAGAVDRQVILQDLVQTVAAIQDADASLLALVSPEDGTLRPVAHYRLPAEVLTGFERVLPGDGVSGRCLATRTRVIGEDLAAGEENGEPNPIRQAGFRGIQATPLVAPTGQVLGVLTTFLRQAQPANRRELNLVDLTIQIGVDFLERGRLYAELQEMDRAKNRFLAILSHELRNPLAPIRTAVEMVHLTSSSLPELSAPLSVIDRQITQMARLIDDLLDVSRISNAKLVLRREPVEIASILQAAIEASRPALAASDHELQVSLPETPIWVNADPTRLAQVLGNLLNNAGKYTPESGQIRVRVEREDSTALVRVSDNGIGIPAPMLSRVFEMFTQVDDSTTKSKGGLGIGLTLAQRLVEMHGGTIEARSEGLGKGSEFIVRLPMVPAPVESAPVVDTGPHGNPHPESTPHSDRGRQPGCRR